ncbi:MAG TPA: hypothetical protein VN644_11950 [Pyrinomonadaceae bacterium]|nr:hypothetical protein [Pyrinomonadaceae bacterium]
MNSRMLRNRCVMGLIVVALIAGCFQLKSNWWQPTEVHAQMDDDDDGLSGGALAVLLLGPVGSTQKLRLSVGTITTAPAPYSWSVVVRDQFNAVLFRSERIEVPSGEWRFSDVFGAAFVQSGKGDTPVMVQVLVEGPGAGSASEYIGSAQVIDMSTGESSNYLKLNFTTASIVNR